MAGSTPTSSAASPPSTLSPPGPGPSDAPRREGEVRDAGAAHHAAISARRWSSDGVSKVLGDAEADEAVLSGAVSVRGRLSADRVTIRGTLEVEGATRVARSLDVSGDARFSAAVDAGEMRVDGVAEIAGSLAVAQGLACAGHLQVGGDLTAQALRFDGRLTVRGKVAAKQVEGRLRGVSRADAILATTVAIDRRAPLFGAKGRLEVLRIEADEVRLAGVECQFVKADRIHLGPDCHVALVEGTVIERHPSAHVGPESTSPRPYGLSR